MPGAVVNWHKTVYHKTRHDGFYMSPKWRRTRREVFYRDHYHCLRCDKRFKTEELTPHHLIPRDEGGSDDTSNLVTMCNPCHDYAEVQGLRTQADIIGSYDKPVVIIPARARPLDDIDDGRPVWHKWVYGGVKRRT